MARYNFKKLRWNILIFSIFVILNQVIVGKGVDLTLYYEVFFCFFFNEEEGVLLSL